MPREIKINITLTDLSLAFIFDDALQRTSKVDIASGRCLSSFRIVFYCRECPFFCLQKLCKLLHHAKVTASHAHDSRLGQRNVCFVPPVIPCGKLPTYVREGFETSSRVTPQKHNTQHTTHDVEGTSFGLCTRTFFFFVFLSFSVFLFFCFSVFLFYCFFVVLFFCCFVFCFLFFLFFCFFTVFQELIWSPVNN